MSEFEHHVQARLRGLNDELLAAVSADEPDRVASLSFEIDDLERLSRANQD